MKISAEKFLLFGRDFLLKIVCVFCMSKIAYCIFFRSKSILNSFVFRNQQFMSTLFASSTLSVIVVDGVFQKSPVLDHILNLI